MLYRSFGRTGEEVSALAFGCMRLSTDTKEAVRSIRVALDEGIVEALRTCL